MRVRLFCDFVFHFFLEFEKLRQKVSEMTWYLLSFQHIIYKIEIGVFYNQGLYREVSIDSKSYSKQHLTYFTMTPAEITSVVGVILAAIFCILSSHRVQRTGGRIWYYHLVFVLFMIGVLCLMPETIQFQIFSPVGVAVVGMVFPIYESIRAACTPGTDDDTAWLQYWIAMEIIAYSTEWVDDVATRSPAVREHWYEFEFFYFLWLLLPFTDGAKLTFDYITKPLLGPVIVPITAKLEGWITMIVMAFINSAHLWLLWAVFVILPAFLKRFMTVTFGTIFPVMASIVAVTTKETDDDTYWLTYWSCYGITFLLMDWIEAYLGHVPGFYTVIIFFIVYLMLPLFGGAEQVFRKILVPLTGLQEVLLLRDAALLRREMEAQIDPKRWKELRKAMAKSFHDDDDDNEEPEKVNLVSSSDYGSINNDEILDL